MQFIKKKKKYYTFIFDGVNITVRRPTCFYSAYRTLL